MAYCGILAPFSSSVLAVGVSLGFRPNPIPITLPLTVIDLASNGKMTARSTPVTKRSVILKCHPARSSHRGGVLNLGKRLYGVAWTDLKCI